MEKSYDILATMEPILGVIFLPALVKYPPSSFMGQKSRIMLVMVIALGIGIVTSVSTVFAVESNENTSNPLNILFNFFQALKYSLILDETHSLTPSTAYPKKVPLI